MSDVLQVGVDAARKAMPEVRIETKTHPGGNPGVAKSVEAVNAKILAGAKDPRILEWAGQALKKAGDPTRTRDRAQAVLEAQRAQTVYIQDPPGVERVQRATMTLCLEGGRGLCLRAGDCDDLVVVLGAALMSLGISVRTVIQAYGGSDVYQHILIEFLDDDTDQWVRADPSHRTWPVGQSAPASKEKSFDPMDKSPLALTGSGDFVGVGRVGTMPITHTVHVGETPATIAERYTGEPMRFPELVTANPHKARTVWRTLPNFRELVEGEVLALPASWWA